MVLAVVTCKCEDHVSPVLRSLSHMLLTVPIDAHLPPLPESVVEAEQHQRGSDVGIKLLPSAALLAWIADVKRMHSR